MTKPQRIRFNRFDGVPLPPNTVLVTRPGRFGNIFNWKSLNDWWLDPKAAKAKAKQQFKDWLDGKYSIKGNERQWILDHLYLIREAEFVACSCKLGEPCHADVLIELVLDKVN